MQVLHEHDVEAVEVLRDHEVSGRVVAVIVGSMEEAAHVVDVITAGENHGSIRYEDPVLGRFISRDPLGYVHGASLYVAYFVPGKLDSSGLGTLVLCHCQVDDTYSPPGSSPTTGPYKIGIHCRCTCSDSGKLCDKYSYRWIQTPWAVVESWTDYGNEYPAANYQGELVKAEEARLEGKPCTCPCDKTSPPAPPGPAPVPEPTPESPFNTDPWYFIPLGGGGAGGASGMGYGGGGGIGPGVKTLRPAR